MKEIKTVISPLNCVKMFDKNINCLLAEGWKLKKRAVISSKGEPNDVGSCAEEKILYAELEK